MHGNYLYSGNTGIHANNFSKGRHQSDPCYRPPLSLGSHLASQAFCVSRLDVAGMGIASTRRTRLYPYPYTLNSTLNPGPGTTRGPLQPKGPWRTDWLIPSLF